MEISPIRVLELILASFVFGMVTGVFNDICRLFRMLHGVKYKKKELKRLTNIRLPVIGEAGRERTQKKFEGIALFLVTVLLDILLFLIAAVGSVVLNYYFNDGFLRIYAPASLFLGFVFYYFTFGRLFVWLSDIPIFTIRLILSVFLAIFYLPIRRIVEIFVKISKKTAKNIKNAIAKRKERVYNNKRSNISAENSENIKENIKDLGENT